MLKAVEGNADLASALQITAMSSTDAILQWEKAQWCEHILACLMQALGVDKGKSRESLRETFRIATTESKWEASKGERKQCMMLTCTNVRHRCKKHQGGMCPSKSCQDSLRQCTLLFQMLQSALRQHATPRKRAMHACVQRRPNCYAQS